MRHALAIAAQATAIRDRVVIAAAALCLCLLEENSVRAQEFITPDCRPSESIATLKFDDQRHRAWYRRFWSGQCDGLAPFTCFVGDPNWNDVVRRLALEAPPADRPRMVVELCAMGQLLGFEWARDNAIRRVSTHDLEGLTHLLEGPGPLPRRLGLTYAKIQSLLARPKVDRQSTR